MIWRKCQCQKYAAREWKKRFRKKKMISKSLDNIVRKRVSFYTRIYRSMPNFRRLRAIELLDWGFATRYILLNSYWWLTTTFELEFDGRSPTSSKPLLAIFRLIQPRTDHPEFWWSDPNQPETCSLNDWGWTPIEPYLHFLLIRRVCQSFRVL